MTRAGLELRLEEEDSPRHRRGWRAAGAAGALLTGVAAAKGDGGKCWAPVWVGTETDSGGAESPEAKDHPWRRVCPAVISREMWRPASRENISGTSLPIQWLRLCIPNAGGIDSILGQGTMVSHVTNPHMSQLGAHAPQEQFTCTTTREKAHVPQRRPSPAKTINKPKNHLKEQAWNRGGPPALEGRSWPGSPLSSLTVTQGCAQPLEISLAWTQVN